MNKLINKIFSFFSCNKKQETAVTAPVQPVNKIYSVQELQNMYGAQDTLTVLEGHVLRLAMWDRARRAGYHGYAKNWGNIQVLNGVISVCGLNNGVKINAETGVSYC